MLKSLLLIRFAALRASMFRAAKTAKWKTVGLAALLLYCAAIFMVVFSNTFRTLSQAFAPMGLGWLYFAVMALLIFGMQFFLTVFMAKAQLFEAQDNTLLLSMPIPPRLILLSRVLILFLEDLAIELLIAGPAVVVWLLDTTIPAWGVVALVLLLLALPLFSLAATSLFAWLLALLTARIQKKSLLSTICSLLLFVLYFYGYSNLNRVTLALAANASSFAGKIHAALPLYWIGSAVANGNLRGLIGGMACLLLPAAAAWWILSVTFLRLTTVRHGGRRHRVKPGQLQCRSAGSALYWREGKRFLEYPEYLLNCGFGVLVELAAGVALLVKGKALLAILPVEEGLLTVGLVFALCFITGMTAITACSISLEGKTLWQLRSMPIRPQAVLWAKLQLHLSVAMPLLLFASVAGILVLQPGVPLAICLLITPQICTALTAQIGLALELRNPNFNWMSRIQVVKQGMNGLFTILLMLAIVCVPAVGCFLLTGWLSGTVFVLLYTAALAIAVGLLAHWIWHTGAMLWERL